MRLKPLLVCVALSMLAVPLRADEPKAPFTVSVVPSFSRAKERSITTAEKWPRAFYVILTNVSDCPQPVWEAACSWGYQNVSFEVILPDGKRLPITKKGQRFTVNRPEVFVIPPGGQQIYPIRLDAEWENCPILTAPGEVPVTLKAIFSVDPTPQSTEQGVWTGRVESASDSFMLRHWRLPEHWQPPGLAD